jgi:hypothetical protein
MYLFFEYQELGHCCPLFPLCYVGCSYLEVVYTCLLAFFAVSVMSFGSGAYLPSCLLVFHATYPLGKLPIGGDYALLSRLQSSAHCAQF